MVDINIAGMVTHFIYEDFHQNHKYDLERDTLNFLKMFFNKKSTFYKDYHNDNTVNQDEINRFRDLFDEFELQLFKISAINLDKEEALVQFKITFSAKTATHNTKLIYSGNGSISYEYKYGFWSVAIVNLPI